MPVKHLLFPSDQLRSRQLILNLYAGAEGLSPHVDLVNRFADGIILCSFGPQGTGTVMDFTHERQASEHLFLPSGSVVVLSGQARYDWKHGISARDMDRRSDK
uniref:Fe2OG dioxygenase domain-containing protein n=1 Tax=Kalmanozyma brasiliensis (strain GHG001) TaxID=1365824 RepID=V5EZF5_KALBG